MTWTYTCCTYKSTYCTLFCSSFKKSVVFLVSWCLYRRPLLKVLQQSVRSDCWQVLSTNSCCVLPQDDILQNYLTLFQYFCFLSHCYIIILISGYVWPACHYWVFSLLLTETMEFTTDLEFDAVASLSKRMSKDRVPSTVHDSAGDR
jgi:hypothetical protein